MRALSLCGPALLLASMAGAPANVAWNDAWCAQSDATSAKGGVCAKRSAREPSVDRPLIAQGESPSPSAGAPDRKQSSMPQATKQQKMRTCEFGANDQKLTGAARKTFLAKCLANDDAPAPRTSAKPKAQQ
jgi:hypothetical protein